MNCQKTEYTDKCIEYIEVLADALRARFNGHESADDKLLEKLDSIWFEMQDSDRKRLDSLVEQILKQNINKDELQQEN